MDRLDWIYAIRSSMCEGEGVFLTRDVCGRNWWTVDRVAQSPACRMGHSELAVVFGPAVVGWSDDPASDPAAQQLVSQSHSLTLSRV